MRRSRSIALQAVLLASSIAPSFGCDERARLTGELAQLEVELATMQEAVAHRAELERRAEKPSARAQLEAFFGGEIDMLASDLRAENVDLSQQESVRTGLVSVRPIDIAGPSYASALRALESVDRRMPFLPLVRLESGASAWRARFHQYAIVGEARRPAREPPPAWFFNRDLRDRTITVHRSLEESRALLGPKLTRWIEEEHAARAIEPVRAAITAHEPANTMTRLALDALHPGGKPLLAELVLSDPAFAGAAPVHESVNAGETVLLLTGKIAPDAPPSLAVDLTARLGAVLRVDDVKIDRRSVSVSLRKKDR